MKLEIPQSLKIEHEALHSTLVKATKVAGATGEAARAVAARAEGHTQYADFAEELKLHARTEEEVMYPAAVLVGEYIKRAT